MTLWPRALSLGPWHSNPSEKSQQIRDEQQEQLDKIVDSAFKKFMSEVDRETKKLDALSPGDVFLDVLHELSYELPDWANKLQGEDLGLGTHNLISALVAFQNYGPGGRSHAAPKPKRAKPKAKRVVKKPKPKAKKK